MRNRRKRSEVNDVNKGAPYVKAQGMAPSAKRPSPRPGRLEGNSVSLNVIGALGRTSVPSAPPPNLYQAASGRVVSTEPIRDRFMNSKVAVWAPHTTPIQFFLPSGPQYLQDGSNDDVELNSTIGPLSKELYSMIVRELMIDGNLYLRDTILENTATGNDSFGVWITAYCDAFVTLRGIQGCLAMGNFNYAASRIADAVNQRTYLLEGALRQLYTFSVPPMLIRYLDRLCGPKANSEDDALIIANVNGLASGNADLTDPTLYDTLIPGALTTLQQLAAGSAFISATDAGRIANIFAMAYGTPEIPLDKGIEFDECVYAMHRFQAATYRNNTTTLSYTYPNMNVSPGDTVPIIIPRNASGEVVHQMMSLLRTPVYGIDPLAGLNTSGGNLPMHAGMWANYVGSAGNAASATVLYRQDGAYVPALNSGAGTRTYGYTNAETELLPWIAEAGVAATDYSGDTRVWDGLDRTYLTKRMLLDETMFILEEMFLNPIRSKR